MTNRTDGAVHRQFQTLFNLGAFRDLTDGQLLERFSTGHGEVAELAFAALVERHGAMVMRVCHAGLGDVNDAHDAFQATFLILLRKAESLWVRDSLGPWLHQVALRTSRRARSMAAKRRSREEQAARAESVDRREEQDADLEPLLHEEIHRLPERYRVPIVLCDLEGQSCEQVARLLGRPVGTVKSWRARGRERLRERLLRRGLAPSAAIGLVIAADAARGAVPESLAARMASGTFSTAVQTLMKGVLMTMIFGKIRHIMTAVLALGIVTAGLGSIARVAADDPKGKAGPPRNAEVRAAVAPAGESGERWELSLREALLTSLQNSEIIQGVKPDPTKPPGEGYAITRIKGDRELQTFRAEMMAHLRSVEQLYWSLAGERMTLEADRKAVELTEAALTRAEAEFKAGRAKEADVKDAKQQLSQRQFIYLNKSYEIKAGELRLRNIIGISLVDNRRIIPVTEPTAKHFSPDWSQCLHAMKENQPDNVQQQARLDELDQGDDAKTRSRQRHEALISQVRDRTTQTLSRFFHEIEADYNQFKTAANVRAARESRLSHLREAFEEGRCDGTTLNGYLDAISTHAEAVAAEAQAQSAYNISIVALEEAKGTLLDHYGFTIADAATSKPAATSRRDDATRLAQHESPIASNASVDRPEGAGTSLTPADASDLNGKAVNFRFTVGLGPRPLEIRGFFTVTPANAATPSTR